MGLGLGLGLGLGRLCRRDVDDGAHVAPQLDHAALGHALHAISQRHLGRGEGEGEEFG